MMFKSYMDYKVWLAPESEATDLVNNAPETDKVSFNLGRIVADRVEGETWEEWLSHGLEPFMLELERKAIEDFLKFSNYELEVAIYYYLNGCERQEYFLIEYYKCLETIRNYFGNKKEMGKKLRPYGLSLKAYDRLKRCANDELRPLDIGRHAPKKGARLTYMDVRRLLTEPKSREILEDSSRTCRGMIDAFLSYVKAAAGR